jgi:hypothetical protein
MTPKAGVDIDMNESVNCNTTTDSGDECHVRTVPIRASLDVPDKELCNDTVTIDDFLARLTDGTTGNVRYTITDASDDVQNTCSGASTAPCTMLIESDTGGEWSLTTSLVLVSGSVGKITNAVHLEGHHRTFNGGDIDESTICCDREYGDDSAMVTLKNSTVTCPPTDPNCNCGHEGQEPCPEENKQFCTYTRGKFNPHSNNQMATVTVPANFGAITAGGLLRFGKGNQSDNAAPYAGEYNATGYNQFRAILNANCPGCQTGSLGADAGNNPSTSAASNQVAQTLVLSLAVRLSDLNLPNAANSGLGAVKYCASGWVGTFCAVQDYTILELINISNTILSGDNATYPDLMGSRSRRCSTSSTTCLTTAAITTWRGSRNTPTFRWPRRPRSNHAITPMQGCRPFGGGFFFGLADIPFEGALKDAGDGRFAAGALRRQPHDDVGKGQDCEQGEEPGGDLQGRFEARKEGPGGGKEEKRQGDRESLQEALRARVRYKSTLQMMRSVGQRPIADEVISLPRANDDPGGSCLDGRIGELSVGH